MTTETLISDLKEDEASPAAARAKSSVDDSRQEISLLDLIVTIVDRKRFVLTVTAVFMVLSIIVSLILPPKYTARIILLPPQQSSSSLGAMMMSQLGNLGSIASLASSELGIKSQNEMFVTMLQSRTVEDGMVEKYHLMDEYHRHYISDARKAFEDHATVDGKGKDGLIRISVEDRDPKRAAELANGYIDEFRHLTEHLAITEASQRRLFFQQQLEKSKDDLANAEDAMKKMEQKTGLIQLDSQSRALIESAAMLRAQISAKEVQIQAMQTYATGENAQLLLAQQELSSLRAQLAQLGGSADTDSEGIIVPKGKVPEAGLEYLRALREVKYQEAIFEILARQFELAKLDEARQGALVQVVDAAVPPDKRSFPKRGYIVMGATVVGFLVGVFTVFVQRSFRRYKSDPETGRKLDHLRNSFSFRK